MGEQEDFGHSAADYLRQDVADAKRLLGGDTSVLGQRAQIALQAVGDTLGRKAQARKSAR